MVKPSEKEEQSSNLREQQIRSHVDSRGPAMVAAVATATAAAAFVVARQARSVVRFQAQPDSTDTATQA